MDLIRDVFRSSRVHQGVVGLLEMSASRRDVSNHACLCISAFNHSNDNSCNVINNRIRSGEKVKRLRSDGQRMS